MLVAAASGSNCELWKRSVEILLICLTSFLLHYSTQVSVCSCGLKDVLLQQYWEFAEPALNAAGTTVDLSEGAPLSWLSHITSPAESRNKNIFRNQSGGLGVLFHNILWFKILLIFVRELSFPSLCIIVTFLPLSHHVLLLLPLSDMMKMLTSPSSSNYCTTGNLKALICLTWCWIMSESKQTKSSCQPQSAIQAK